MSSLTRPAPKPRSQPRKAKRPIPKVNPRRAAARYERDYGEKGNLIRRQACDCTGKRTGDWITDPELGRVLVQVVAAHFPGRGAGGRAKDIVPLAWHLEQRGHQSKGGHKALERQYGLSFKERAAYWESRWQAQAARLASPTAPPTE